LTTYISFRHLITFVLSPLAKKNKVTGVGRRKFLKLGGEKACIKRKEGIAYLQLPGSAMGTEERGRH
jgi:hypothetical protein